MTADPTSLAGKLTDTLTSTDSGLSWLWAPLLRLLATGEPVADTDLAQATGRNVDEVRQALAELPDAEYDEAGRIVGYGLTHRPTQHRFTVDGRPLFTWCALDTLLFPAVLGQVADVESPCWTTGTPVRLTVQPDRVTHVDPVDSVVSLATPDHPGSVRTAFCQQVHFFTDKETAQPWLAEHPEATVLPVAEAFALGQQFAQQHILGNHDDCC